MSKFELQDKIAIHISVHPVPFRWQDFPAYCGDDGGLHYGYFINHVHGYWLIVDRIAKST